MRLGIVLAALFTAAAQVDTPPPPAEPPPLHYTGRPMLVDYQCSDEDIHLAGLSCTLDDPCPMYLELAALEAVGNRIFVAGNIHSPSTTLYSVLLASNDAGKTWREPYERLRASGLDHIQFVDFEHGWISGAVLHPLPHDPFFLITSDGGQSWRYQPISSESSFGSIMQFWFGSRTNGNMLIDRGRSGESGRYELYDTSNGGESWSLKEGSERLIKMKRSGAGNADWRIRADAATKSYRIEHQAAARWRAVAAFAVSIGYCRPS